MILERLGEAGTFPVQFSSSLTSGWTDITSVENIDKYWSVTGKDYKFSRNEIQSIYLTSSSIIEANITNKTFTVDVDITNTLQVGERIRVKNSTANNKYYTISSVVLSSLGETIIYVNETIPSSIGDGLIEYSNWENLTSSQKQICTKWFIASSVEREEVYPLSVLIPLGQLFDKYSMESRMLRISKATSEVRNRLTKSQAQEIINDITESSSLFYNYVTFGREGTAYGDQEGLLDYLMSELGTSYANSGFSSKNYIPTGYSNMSEFAATLKTIIIDGIY